MMKKFLFFKIAKKFFLFGGIFLLIDSLLPLLLFFFLDEQLQKKYNQNLPLKPVDVLILGDSHAAAALDPEIFSKFGLKTLHAGKSDHYAEFNYYFYKYFRKKYSKPKLVIISTSFFYLSPSKLPDFYIFMNKNDLIRNYIDNFFYNPIKTSNYGAIYKEQLWRLVNKEYNSALYYSLGGYGEAMNKNFLLSDLSKIYKPAINLKMTDIVKDGYSSKDLKNKRSLNYLKKLFGQLENDKVSVLLIETPEYIETQQSITGKGLFYKQITQIIQSFNNIRFLKQKDFSVIDFNDKSMFFDGGPGRSNSHLSLKGSKIYTQAIIDFIKDNNMLNTP